jgi:hypothetical protein
MTRSRWDASFHTDKSAISTSSQSCPSAIPFHSTELPDNCSGQWGASVPVRTRSFHNKCQRPPERCSASVSGDPYLERDTVFGVKPSLIVPPEKRVVPQSSTTLAVSRLSRHDP